MILITDNYDKALLMKVHKTGSPAPCLTEVIERHFHPEHRTTYYLAVSKDENPKLYADILADRTILGSDLPEHMFTTEAVAAEMNLVPSVIIKVHKLEFDAHLPVQYEAVSISRMKMGQVKLVNIVHDW